MLEVSGLSKDDEHFMRLALAYARKAAERGEVPVGAVIIDGEGRLVAADHNRPIELCDPSAHAEILVIRKAAQRLGNYRLEGCILYTTLEPCVMCFGAMIHARIKCLVYGAPDPRAGAFHVGLDLTTRGFFNHYMEVREGVLGTEAAEILRGFFLERRRAR
ncbi:tRNA adenosine(34) deaminase TadA [Thermodesulforhabdus norvegica]|uniref:tRNA-specific adenosine deaminase n=1 Tax=Thermodesulforhabdus norvegica TaxID=39841 RepID=A0A1I4TTR2_9BACT|nr:tRNA adenosine(34) deaminase TadA [Thermodesulforhabdus norvegica]SFM79947.1 tRNA(Arg) A34 adenosine deaminase TadA [Thermodesulforhabdus norvegica]